MKKLFLFAIVFLLLSSAASAAYLTGQTPSSYSLPPGWSLIRAQGFENGCGADEWCGRWNGTIDNSKPHSGTYGIRGLYSNNQADVGWSISEAVAGQTNAIGSFTEIYISFYEWVDSAARFNDELFMANLSRGPIGSGGTEVVLDWYGWATLQFNATEAILYQVSNGTQGGIRGGWTTTVPTGAWHQWEIHYRPNTSGASNGFYKVYVDGTQVINVNNDNFNGTTDMSNCSLQIGGVYSKNVWMTDYPTCTACSSQIGTGTDECTNLYFGGRAFNNQPCAPNVPNFFRWFDDIIVMKIASGSSGGSVPYASNWSPAKSSTGVLVTNRTIQFHVKDDVDVLTANGVVNIEGVNYTCAAGLSCIGNGTADATITYTKGSDWAYSQTVNISTSGFRDTLGNVMPTDTWSFQTDTTPPTALAVTTTTLAQRWVGTTFTTTLAATGGTSPYTWSVVSGSLPAGTTLSSGGVLSGTATTAGTYNFTVRVTDNLSAIDDQALSLLVNAATPGGQTTKIIPTDQGSFADTYVNSGGDGNTNFSSSTTNRVIQWPGYTADNRIFDNIVLGVPANASVLSATLYVYLEGYLESGGSNPMRIFAQRISGTVPNISTVTYNNFAGTLEPYESYVDAGLTPGWISFNVTQMVAWAYANNSPLYIALDGGANGASYTNRLFTSMEGAAAFRPYLSVTYMNLVAPGGPAISAPGKMRVSKMKGTFR